MGSFKLIIDESNRDVAYSIVQENLANKQDIKVELMNGQAQSLNFFLKLKDTVTIKVSYDEFGIDCIVESVCKIVERFKQKGINVKIKKNDDKKSRPDYSGRDITGGCEKGTYQDSMFLNRSM